MLKTIWEIYGTSVAVFATFNFLCFIYVDEELFPIYLEDIVETDGKDQVLKAVESGMIPWWIMKSLFIAVFVILASLTPFVRLKTSLNMGRGFIHVLKYMWKGGQ